MLADAYVMQFRAQSYHWNVKGMFFEPLHSLFGKIYVDVNDSIDIFAEYLRISGFDAPVSIAELYKHTSLTEDHTVLPPRVMIASLYDTNKTVLSSLDGLMEAAVANKEHGVADYVSSRIDSHKKWGWMLSAHLAE